VIGTQWNEIILQQKVDVADSLIRTTPGGAGS